MSRANAPFAPFAVFARIAANAELSVRDQLTLFCPFMSVGLLDISQQGEESCCQDTIWTRKMGPRACRPVCGSGASQHVGVVSGVVGLVGSMRLWVLSRFVVDCEPSHTARGPWGRKHLEESLECTSIFRFFGSCVLPTTPTRIWSLLSSKLHRILSFKVNILICLRPCERRVLRECQSVVGSVCLRRGAVPLGCRRTF